MSKPVFVDTSAWFALESSKDRNHRRASELLPSLARSRSLITSNHVLGESYTLMSRLLGHDAATGFIRSLNRSRRVEILFTPQEMEKKAYQLLQQYADQRFSFVDATSFVWMRKLRVREAFTFDQHFETAGFVALGRAS
ncbi:MAG: type II toxin-antitoxin system VapC family toxin [Thermoleophilia bacterium]